LFQDRKISFCVERWRGHVVEVGGDEEEVEKMIVIKG
jgi:hypothetical protein